MSSPNFGVGAAITCGGNVIESGPSPDLVGNLAAELVANGLTGLTDTTMWQIDEPSIS